MQDTITIEEAIKHCEDVAYQNEILMKRYDDASGYNRSHNEKIRTDGAKGCEHLTSLYRQMAEWLRELKAFHDAMDIIPTTPFDVDLGKIPINNRSYDDIVKCLMIAYERGKNDTLSLIEQYILEGKR